MGRKKKKCTVALCVLLSVALFLSGVMSADALTPPPDKEDITLLDDQDLFISEEVAKYIAEFFIQDMVATNQTIWDTNTIVVDMVPMYDQFGLSITAYTAILTDGYVIVSAYVDMPSLIPEWSDVDSPVFSSMEKSNEDKIVYLGGLDYFIENGSDLLSADGFTIKKKDICGDYLASNRNMNNVSDSVKEYLVQRKETIISLGESLNDNHFGEYVTDPYIYAYNVKGAASWTYLTHSNLWNYSNPAFVTTDAYYSVGYPGCCGVVAMSNLLKLYGLKYSLSGSNLGNLNNYTLFTKAMNVSQQTAGNPFYSSDYGTPDAVIPTYVSNLFSFCNLAPNVSATDVVPISSSSDITEPLKCDNKLIYLNLNKIKPYAGSDPVNSPKNHAVIAFAWTRLKKNGDANTYVTFAKIADGFNMQGRYIHLELLLSSPISHEPSGFSVISF